MQKASLNEDRLKRLQAMNDDGGEEVGGDRGDGGEEARHRGEEG